MTKLTTEMTLKRMPPMINEPKRNMSTMPTPLTAMSAAGCASAIMHTIKTPNPANVRFVTSSSFRTASCCQYTKKLLNVNTRRFGMLTPVVTYGVNSALTSAPVKTSAFMASSKRMHSL